MVNNTRMIPQIANVPIEVIRIICSFMSNLENMFVSGNVSLTWRREIAFPILLDNLKRIHSDPIDDEITDYNYFKTVKIGRNFIRMELRRFLYEFSLKLYDFQNLNQNSKPPLASIDCNEYLLEEFEQIQFYFSHFSIPKLNLIEKKTEKTGLFKMISSLFSKQPKKQEKTNDEPIIVDINKNRVVEKEPVTEIVCKIALDGYRATGRTSFLNASLRDDAIVNKDYYPSIGIDFAARIFSFPEVLTNIYKVQVWDSPYSQLQPAYVNNTTMIMEVFDLTKRETLVHLINENIPQIKRLRQTPLELVFIGTKQDVIQENPQTRNIPPKDIQTCCLNNFGGALCVELSLTELKQAQSLIWYSVLLQDICYPKNLKE
ncbi:predicted protein [Naegleria gruberi]|uniref:Predicted protein n=1 Tax=Naegleria gruberi TaxID=5762 RepID=D2VM38_NAEGR|nr:uncharacterized protein NAEGRDRAFT_50687 [Naegleria gruberi]EFC42161.1 predicted protein [Naegleria gruberi]|eukprot:XP_002674905.1 predicted protein [Naegleria gruberi strain NEG-M]